MDGGGKRFGPTSGFGLVHPSVCPPRCGDVSRKRVQPDMLVSCSTDGFHIKSIYHYESLSPLGHEWNMIITECEKE